MVLVIDMNHCRTEADKPQDKRALLKQWLDSGEARLEPLAFPQRELWEASPVPVSDVANHICCLIDLGGPVTAQECEAALQQVVDRQEALRTSFLPGRERPLQMIRRKSRANFGYMELSPAQRRDEAVEELAKEVFAEPFELVKGPLYRVKVFRRGMDDKVLVLAIHHAIADGWSLGVFVQDLCFAYVQGLLSSRQEVRPLPLGYSAWGAQERAFWQPSELNRRAIFWKSKLAGHRRLWNCKEGTELESCVPERLVSCIPRDLADGAREMARHAGVTLFSSLLTAFQIALHQWTGEDDVLVGTPVANRGSQAVRETMGYCSGVVPIRGRIDRGRSFSESLRAVHRNNLDCFENSMPFVELALALGESPRQGHNPIFEIRFALQNHPVPDVAVHGLSARLKMRSTGTARFHIGCEITSIRNGFEVVWVYRSKLFSLAEIKELGYLFQTVLAQACASPESRIAAISK